MIGYRTSHFWGRSWGPPSLGLCLLMVAPTGVHAQRQTVPHGGRVAVRIADTPYSVHTTTSGTTTTNHPSLPPTCTAQPTGDPGERVWCTHTSTHIEFFNEAVGCGNHPIARLPLRGGQLELSPADGRSDIPATAGESVGRPTHVRGVRILRVAGTPEHEATNLQDADANSALALRAHVIALRTDWPISAVELTLAESEPTHVRVQNATQASTFELQGFASPTRLVLPFVTGPFACLEVVVDGDIHLAEVRAVTPLDEPHAAEVALVQLRDGHDVDHASRVLAALLTEHEHARRDAQANELLERIRTAWPNLQPEVRVALARRLQHPAISRYALAHATTDEESASVAAQLAAWAQDPMQSNVWWATWLEALVDTPNASNLEAFEQHVHARMTSDAATALAPVAATAAADAPTLRPVLAALLSRADRWDQLGGHEKEIWQFARAAALLPSGSGPADASTVRATWLNSLMPTLTTFETRWAFIEACAGIENMPQPVTDKLRTFLHAPEWMVRSAAAATLADSLTAEERSALLQDEYPRVRLAVLPSLTPDEQTRALNDPWDIVRAAAVTRYATPNLFATYATDRSALVRVAALHWLRPRMVNAGTCTTEIAATLNAILTNTDEWPEVAVAALESIESQAACASDGVLAVIRRGFRPNAWERDVVAALYALHIARQAGGTLAEEAEVLASRNQEQPDDNQSQ